MIKLIEPQLKKYLQIKEDYKFLIALDDLDVRNDDELNCLCPEFKAILSRREQILQDFKSDPTVLDRIYGFLTDFFIDRFKIKGNNVKTKLPQLIELINEYQYDQIVAFFIGTPDHGQFADDDLANVDQYNEMDMF